LEPHHDRLQRTTAQKCRAQAGNGIGDGNPHRCAAALLRSLWERGIGLISIQVLQEMYVNVTRRIPQPLSLAAARGLVNLYRVWQVEVPSVETLLRASEIQDRNQLSFWDAMIVATAVQAGAEVLLSDVLNHGQVIEGVQITNPFAH
jgi:predicted nucleic acid-binding protein